MSLERLIRSGRRKPLFTPGPTARPLELDQPAIERMVPHRPPFLLVERLSALDPDQHGIVGHRRVDPADPVLAGHFPGDPVYPGVLLVETIAQTCLCLQTLLTGGEHARAGADPPRLRLLRVHHAVFLDEARPGDELTILGQVVEDNGYTATLAGQALREETICTLAILEAIQLD